MTSSLSNSNSSNNNHHHHRRRLLLVFGLLSSSWIQYVTSQGTGVTVRPEMDHCSGAQGPRPITNQRSPGTTLQSTIDDLSSVNGGYCGVEINTPGIWWWVNGTGDTIRASSCDEGTQIKVKMSVFTGDCNNLRCVAGGSRPDYECSITQKGESNEWGSISTAVDFPTFKGQAYYILVQQMSLGDVGSVWMRFRHPNKPRNSDCPMAYGPLPRDETRISGTTVDGALSEMPDYCIAESHYPGVWYQLIGTGGSVTLSACAANNIDGFYFSVYNGGFCDAMSCVDGEYTSQISDPERCTFGATDDGLNPGVVRPKTAFTFNTKDRDRYFIYVHYALTTVDKPTSPFFLWVDDGQNGQGSSSGAGQILFQRPDGEVVQGDASVPVEDDSGNNNGNNNGNVNSNNNNNESGGTSTKSTFITMVGSCVLGSSLTMFLSF